jgi:hypothetical protein
MGWNATSSCGSSKSERVGAGKHDRELVAADPENAIPGTP